MLRNSRIINVNFVRFKVAQVALILGTLVLSMGAGLEIATQEVEQHSRLAGFAVLVVLSVIILIRPKWGLYVVLWVIYFNDILWDLLPGTQIFSAGKFIGFVVIMGWLARQVMKGSIRVHLGTSGWLFIAILFQMFLSAWVNREFEASAFLAVMTGLVFYVLIVNLAVERKDFDLILTHLIVIGAVIAFLGFLKFQQTGFSVRISARENGLLSNVNEMSFFLNIVLPFVLVSTLKSNHWRFAALILAVFLILIIVASASRGAVVTTGIILFVLAVRYKPIRLVAVVSTSLVIALSPYLHTVSYIWRRFLSVDQSSYGSILGRVNALSAGIDMAISKPITGVGPLRWEAVANPYGIIRGTLLSDWVPNSPHNTYLQALSELGVPGIVLLLALFGLLGTKLFRLWRARAMNESEDSMIWAMSTLLISYMFALATLNHLYSRDLFIVVGMIEAYCIILQRDSRPKHGK